MKPHSSIQPTPFLMLVLVLAWSGCSTRPITPSAELSESPAASLAPLPEAVTSFGAVSHDGWLYVCGGHRGERHAYNAEDVSGAFHRLRISEGTRWEPLPSVEPAQGSPLVVHGDFLYRVGGMAARNARGEKQDLQSRSSVKRFNLRTRRWQDVQSLPAARSSHDAVVVGDELYVAGGWELQGGTQKPIWHDSMLVLDLSRSDSRWRTVPQPFRKRAVALAALGDTLFVLGGMDETGKPSLSVDTYNTMTGTWAKGPDLPAGPMKGFGCSAIAHQGRLYCSGMKGELYVLSESGEHWEQSGRLTYPRFFHRLVPAGRSHLIAAGGEDSEGKRSDLEILSAR